MHHTSQHRGGVAALERRPAVALDTVHFTPDVDHSQVVVDARLNKPAPRDMSLQLRFQPRDRAQSAAAAAIKPGADSVQFSVPLEKLQPGRYTCQVSVVNPTERKFAVWRAPVILLP